MMATDENKDKKDEEAGPNVELFESWVQKHYGENSRTKTITSEKYLRICQLIRGEDSNTNAKFRFWVRSKGFRLITHDKNTDEVTDDPSGSLYVSLHAKEDHTPVGERSIESFLRTNLPAISFFRKVAMVEEFYDIIKNVHVDEKGVHAGQKKTYRLVSDTYAFLPREVITFYLLNCNTCKPRIQKYGPIHSKVRTNNNIPQKIAPEKSPLQKNPSEQEVYPTRENPKSNQVIRPSPKRFRPTSYAEETFPESYGSGKMYESHLKPKNMSDVPAVHILDERGKHFNTERQVYHANMMQVRSPDLQAYPSNWSPRNKESSYMNIPPPHTSSDTAMRELKTTSPTASIPVRTSDNQKDLGTRMGTKDVIAYSKIEGVGIKGVNKDTQEVSFHPKNKLAPSSEYATCSSSCCAYLNSTVNYVESKKDIPERFYGSRLQPYRLFQRNDNLRNYQAHILAAGHNKGMSQQAYSVPYLAESKDRYMSLYREDKGAGKMEYSPQSPLWRKTFITADIRESSWKALSKRAMEKTYFDYFNTCQ